MATFGDGLKDIFLAGVGALAITGEKAKEIVDTLIEKGEISVEQGKQINTELQHKADKTIGKIRDEALGEHIKSLSAEDREAFMASITRMVDEAQTADAQKSADADSAVADAEKPEA